MRPGRDGRRRLPTWLLLAALPGGLLALSAHAGPAHAPPSQAASAQAATAAPVPAAAARSEIEHLIAQLGRSGCSFQRNGSWHDAAEAEKHLRRKYEWLRDHDRIVSAEQFIEDGASRSSMTGRAYQVRCPGQAAQPSARWLRDRLQALRRPPTGR
ncbi:YfeK family protein [Agrilutibacter solisilvae]|uniref:DUF5329 domain-containing protein n=1 Tax=Agrilutibacter solisilvae TaxID=2763317 RepID=A0A974XYH7_9GAMM|nr:DUF5329 domain-containing protein [Lysobacter solisilvae]QSX78131.1 DUF5329 domain-containing protein [Lysobacter solisilvae]